MLANRLNTILAVALLIFCASANAKNLPLWISGSDGLYHSALNTESGKLSKLKKVIPAQGELSRFGFLVMHPSKDILYAIAAMSDKSTEIHAYDLSNKQPKLVNKLSGLPGGAAHIQINPQGSTLAISYYGSAYAGIYSLNEDGSVNKIIFQKKHKGSSVDPRRQKRAYPHGSIFNKAGDIVHFTDLGTDHVWSYEIKNNKKAKLINKVKVPDGFGPRHIIFDPNYKYAYVTEELVGGVSVLKNNPKSGKLEIVQHQSQVNEAAHELWANVSDLQVHPTGKFLYVLNRGFDEVTVYKINQENGKITFVENEPVRGSIARHFAIDPSGKWFVVGGTTSGTIAVFQINDDGTLSYNRNIVSVGGPKSLVLGR